ncbi:MAG: CRISPR-associated endoribonuclease Cas6 [Saprospiraceae bacterium]|nr:CRISPR-associated endoribonuclease Cas6 [Saprospiraceae bacterium]
MRIYLQLSANREIVPFNYQQSLVGAFHKWLGENELHDDISLYSLSWLSKGIPKKGGLDFPNGTTFYISSPMEDLHQKAVSGIFKDQHIRWGMHVKEVILKVTPDFGERQQFKAQSPILIKRQLADEKYHRYFFPDHELADTYLTETLQHKLQRFQFPTDVQVRFDRDYPKPIIKKNAFHHIDIKATLCPVIVEGHPRAVQFAWEVGVGNSTGIGFGALV